MLDSIYTVEAVVRARMEDRLAEARAYRSAAAIESRRRREAAARHAATPGRLRRRWLAIPF